MKAVDNTTGVLQGQSEFILFFFVDDGFMKGILWPNFKKNIRQSFSSSNG